MQDRALPVAFQLIPKSVLYLPRRCMVGIGWHCCTCCHCEAPAEVTEMTQNGKHLSGWKTFCCNSCWFTRKVEDLQCEIVYQVRKPKGLLGNVIQDLGKRYLWTTEDRTFLTSTDFTNRPETHVARKNIGEVKFVSYGTFKLPSHKELAHNPILDMIHDPTSCFPLSFVFPPICPYLFVYMSMFAGTISCQYRKTALSKFWDLQLLFCVITLLFLLLFNYFLLFHSPPPRLSPFIFRFIYISL